MIRFIQCVKRKEGMEIGEFRHFWNSAEFQSLLDRMVFLTGARRIEKSLTLVVEVNSMLQHEKCLSEPFDGLIEVWVDNAKDLHASIETEEFSELMVDMKRFQSQFVDFSESRRFFTEYNPQEL